MAAAVAELPAVHDIPEGLAIIRGGRSVARRLDNDRQAEFALLRFPRRTWADTGYELRYHIYTGDGEPISVAANSAIEAIVNSGILRPLKVVRGRPPTENLAACVIDAGRLLETPDLPEAAEQESAALEEMPDFDVDMGSVSLTREEIDALLHGGDDEEAEAESEGESEAEAEGETEGED